MGAGAAGVAGSTTGACVAAAGFFLAPILAAAAGLFNEPILGAAAGLFNALLDASGDAIIKLGTTVWKSRVGAQKNRVENTAGVKKTRREVKTGMGQKNRRAPPPPLLSPYQQHCRHRHHRHRHHHHHHHHHHHQQHHHHHQHCQRPQAGMVRGRTWELGRKMVEALGV